MHINGRFLHLIPDNKFIDAAHGIFEEVYPDGNDYVVVKNSSELTHISSFKPTLMDVGTALDPRFINRLPQYRAVFIHFLNNHMRWVAASAPDGTKLAWIGWGADYYHLIHQREDLLLPDTRRLVSQNLIAKPISTHAPQYFLGSICRAIRHPIRSSRKLRAKIKSRDMGPREIDEITLLNRFSSFSPVLEEEYQSVLARQPGFRPRYLAWNYWTEGLGDAGEGDVLGNNILVGNSATPENNHLDTFRLLERVDLGERKIVCPLSYGSVTYGDAVIRDASRRFGRSFLPLRTYMNNQSYGEVLRSCSMAVMNHLRQQAMGNIVLMLWQGASVYMNPRSPAFKAMRKKGILVNDVHDIAAGVRANRAIEHEVLIDQRERLNHYYGRTAILQRTKALFAEFV